MRSLAALYKHQMSIKSGKYQFLRGFNKIKQWIFLGFSMLLKLVSSHYNLRWSLDFLWKSVLKINKDIGKTMIILIRHKFKVSLDRRRLLMISIKTIMTVRLIIITIRVDTITWHKKKKELNALYWNVPLIQKDP